MSSKKTADAPLGLRGARLKGQLLSLKSYNPAESVVVDEVCRLADRLEQYNDMIRSDGLIELMHFRRMDLGMGDEAVIKVTVDQVVSEARQSQLAFQRLIDSLKLESGATAVKKGDVSDDLASRRAARRKAASS